MWPATGYLATSGTVQPFVSLTAESIKSMVPRWSDIHRKFTRAVSLVCKRQETAQKRPAVPQFELLPLTFTLMARVAMSNGEMSQG